MLSVAPEAIVVAVVAEDAVGRSVEHVVAEVVQVERAVVLVERGDFSGAGRRDLVVVDAHAGGVREGGADGVEVALAHVAHPRLRGGGGAARLDGPVALVPAIAQIGAERARVDVKEVAAVGRRAATGRRVRVLQQWYEWDVTYPTQSGEWRDVPLEVE